MTGQQQVSLLKHEEATFWNMWRDRNSPFLIRSDIVCYLKYGKTRRCPTRRLSDLTPQLGQRCQAQLTNQLLRRHAYRLCKGRVSKL